MGDARSRFRLAGQSAAALTALTAMLGCSRPLPVSHFADTAPAFDPVAFFTGHQTSWGVLENRDGGPVAIVTTDCQGTAEGTDAVHMVQHLTVDGTPSSRDWHLRRTGPHEFTATANDMVGTAEGQAYGRVFHWRWVLATKPGQGWRNVTMDQWMYGQPDGSMVNRTTIRKLGVVLAEVTERFSRTP